MFSIEYIKNRIEYLRDAISYSRTFKTDMTLGQSIMCNQEVASWFKILNNEEIKEPKYTIPSDIEKKVETINKKIAREKWVNPKVIF